MICVWIPLEFYFLFRHQRIFYLYRAGPAGLCRLLCVIFPWPSMVFLMLYPRAWPSRYILTSIGMDIYSYLFAFQISMPKSGFTRHCCFSFFQIESPWRHSLVSNDAHTPRESFAISKRPEGVVFNIATSSIPSSDVGPRCPSLLWPFSDQNSLWSNCSLSTPDLPSSLLISTSGLIASETARVHPEMRPRGLAVGWECRETS